MKVVSRDIRDGTTSFTINKPLAFMKTILKAPDLMAFTHEALWSSLPQTLWLFIVKKKSYLEKAMNRTGYPLRERFIAFLPWCKKNLW